MPPLELVDAEALCFHRMSKQVTMPALMGSSARVESIGALGHFVIDAGHLDGDAGLQIIEGEIDSATSIVPGAICRISDEDALVRRRGIPKDFSDVPGAIGIVDEQAIAKRIQLAACSKQSFGRRALHVRFRLGVDRFTEKIPFAGVANIEMNRAIEPGMVDQIRLEKFARFMRRLGGKSLPSQYAERLPGSNVKDAALDRLAGKAFENDAAGLNLSGLAGSIACEDSLLSVVQAGVGEVEDVRSNFGERSEVEPLDQRGELAVFLKNIQLVVIPSIFADESFPAGGDCRGLVQGNALEETVLDANAVGDRADLQAVAQAVVFDEGISGLTEPHLLATRDAAKIQLAICGNEIHGGVACPIVPFQLANPFWGNRGSLGNFRQGPVLLRGEHEAKGHFSYVA